MRALFCRRHMAFLLLNMAFICLGTRCRLLLVPLMAIVRAGALLIVQMACLFLVACSSILWFTTRVKKWLNLSGERTSLFALLLSPSLVMWSSKKLSNGWLAGLKSFGRRSRARSPLHAILLLWKKSPVKWRRPPTRQSRLSFIWKDIIGVIFLRQSIGTRG